MTVETEPPPGRGRVGVRSGQRRPAAGRPPTARCGSSTAAPRAARPPPRTPGRSGRCSRADEGDRVAADRRPRRDYTVNYRVSPGPQRQGVPANGQSTDRRLRCHDLRRSRPRARERQGRGRARRRPATRPCWNGAVAGGRRNRAYYDAGTCSSTPPVGRLPGDEARRLMAVPDRGRPRPVPRHAEAAAAGADPHDRRRCRCAGRGRSHGRLAADAPPAMHGRGRHRRRRTARSRRRPELWIFVTTVPNIQLSLALGTVLAGGPETSMPACSDPPS